MQRNADIWQKKKSLHHYTKKATMSQNPEAFALHYRLPRSQNKKSHHSDLLLSLSECWSHDVIVAAQDTQPYDFFNVIYLESNMAEQIPIFCLIW